MPDDRFLNPYHFVPLATSEPPAQLPKNELASEPALDAAGPHSHVTHARYVRTASSGRLVCRLVVESPLLVANEQEDNAPGSARQGWTTLLKPFELNSGTPAIPGSALRGMLGAVMEAASNSALRVLTDQALSHRATMGESLSAIGMLVPSPTGEDGALRLRPLTIPTLERGPNNNAPWVLPREHQRMFQPGARQPLVKAFIEGYGSRGGAGNANTKNARIEARPGTFLGTNPRRSYSADNEEYWYAKLGSARLLAKGVVQISQDDARTDSRSRQFLLGAQLRSSPISESEYRELSQEECQGYVRGILRVLGVRGREGDIPKQKKHELFIPLPEGLEGPTFEVSGALERFHALADQRFEWGGDTLETALPFSPTGSKRNPAGDPKAPLRLRAGDLVFFRPDPKKPQIVDEVSLSSIWRRGNENTYAYFPQAQLPLGKVSRDTLTLAEQILGVVEERSDKKPAFALAGRIRPSLGLLLDAPQNGAYVDVLRELPQPYRQAMEGLRGSAPEVRRLGAFAGYPLKNLSSPKPPSPALYFTKRTHGTQGTGGPQRFQDGYVYIAKGKLNSRDHAPMGRKVYLRQQHVALKNAFVETGELGGLTDQRKRQAFAKQHTSVARVVRPGAVFHFHVDFDNLSKTELGLLCYALAPSQGYRHQLGHAKPFGLGCCRIEVVGLFLVDRERRYRADALSAPRYHSAWVAEGAAQARLVEQYPREFASVEQGAAKRSGSEAQAPAPTPEGLAKSYRDWAVARGLADCLHALELLGTPVEGRQVPVEYPREQGRHGANADGEHYRWFVNNDHPNTDRHQALRPIRAGETAIPPLARNEPPAPKARNSSRGRSRDGQNRPGPGFGPSRGTRSRGR